MVLLEPEKFLTELEKCFTASKAKKKGSLFVTMKRYDGRTKPHPRNSIPTPSSTATPETSYCLVRVTYGKRKLSCRVAKREMNKFQIAFSALMRTGMSNVGKAVTAPTSQSAPAPAPAPVSAPAAAPAEAASASTTGKSATGTTPKAKSLPAVTASPKKGKTNANK